MTIDEINALFDAAEQEDAGFEPSPEDLDELETLFPRDSEWEQSRRCS